MRRSPLLHTAPANFLFALIVIAVFGWMSLIAAKSVLGYSAHDLFNTALAGDWRLVAGAGLVIGVAAVVGPMLVRQILAKRILVMLTIAALLVIDPLMALTAVSAVLLALGLVRAAYGGVVSTLAQAFDFSDISSPWKILFTFGGALIVVGVATMPRLSLDLSLVLPWPVFSIYGLITVTSLCMAIGFVVGNVYFPKIIHSTWAMLAFFCAMLVINPVVGAIATVYGLLLMFVENLQADTVYYVNEVNGNEDDSHFPYMMENEAGRMIEQSLTPATPESEARGIFNDN